jgi:hypothetical protein
MIAVTLLDYLNSTLDVPVFMEAPEQTSNYVLIDQTASSRTNHIITTTFALQSYGDSLYDAMLLNGEVEEAMKGFAELDEITRVELETDYNFSNTQTKQYRWQAVYSITHY